MKIYPLYLESGPRRKTTMIHIIDLPGCISQGNPTEDALEKTPAAIQTYLRFMQRRGEAVDPGEPFGVEIAEHVMEGPWIGYGNPAPGFKPDFEPLTRANHEVYLRRLKHMEDGLLELVSQFSAAERSAKPEQGRPVNQILEHLAESHYAYFRSVLGKAEGIAELTKAIQANPGGLPAYLPEIWAITRERLEAIPEAEYATRIPHGQVTWTARRMFRRMLEHNWEHLLELSRRVPGHNLF